MDIMALIMAQLPKMGFDPEQIKEQIAGAIGDIHAMKESQDRCETMLRSLISDNQSVKEDNNVK